MGRALPKMNPAEMTQAEVIMHAMNFSRYGALSQLFVMDALAKGEVPGAEHRAKESNEAVVKRLLKADKLTGQTLVIDSVTRLAEALETAGLDKVREQFGPNAMVHPDAWHGVALEILGKLRAAR